MRKKSRSRRKLRKLKEEKIEGGGKKLKHR